MKDVLGVANDVRGIVVDEKKLLGEARVRLYTSREAHCISKLSGQSAVATKCISASFSNRGAVDKKLLGTVVTVGVAKRGPQRFQRFHKRRHA